MSRPPKLDATQKLFVGQLLRERKERISQLASYTLKEIAKATGVQYGVVWRLNAALNGKRNYKSRVTVEMQPTPLED